MVRDEEGGGGEGGDASLRHGLINLANPKKRTGTAFISRISVAGAVLLEAFSHFSRYINPTLVDIFLSSLGAQESKAAVA